MKHILSAIFVGVIVFAAYLLYYLGVFHSVEIAEKNEGSLMLVYTAHVGPYHTIVSNIEKVEKWAKQNSIPCPQSFGRYLDNPDLVEPERLRSQAGCVLDAKPTQELPKDFQLEEIPAGQYIEALFDGAPSIGPMKVYPKALHYIEEHNLTLNGPVMEIYTIIGPKEMKTRYLFPVTKKN